MPLIHILTETIDPTMDESLIDTHRTVDVSTARYYALKTAGAVLKKLYQWRPHLKGGATVTATYYEGSDTTGKVLAKYWD